MPQPRYHPIRIPTKTYLRKFIEFEVGSIVISPGSHPIQEYLYVMLEKRYYKYNFKALAHQFNDTVTILVSNYTFKKIGGGVSPENVIRFNQYVEKLFDMALYKYCHDYMQMNVVMQKTLDQVTERFNISLTWQQRFTWFKSPRYQDALILFCETILQMEIEKDISFDALKKMEYRARKKFEKKKLQPVPCLSTDKFTLLFQ